MSSKYSYNRASHFLSKLRLLQTKQNSEPLPQFVLDGVRRSMEAEQIDPANQTSQTVKRLVLRVPDLSERVSFARNEEEEEEDASHSSSSATTSSATTSSTTCPPAPKEIPLPLALDFKFDDCSICLEAISHDTHQQLDECKHVFHRKCIKLWLKKNESCPVCRARVTIEKTVGMNLDAFARAFERSTLEQLLREFYTIIDAAYSKLTRKRKTNFISYDFCIAKMSQMLILCTSLCESNKKTLALLLNHVHVATNPYRRHKQERMWKRMLRRLDAGKKTSVGGEEGEGEDGAESGGEESGEESGGEQEDEGGEEEINN